MLKGRWRILHNGIEADLPNCTNIATACVVLHNVCIVQDDLWPAHEQIPREEQDNGFTPPDWLRDDCDQEVPDPAERTNMEAAGARTMRESTMAQLAHTLHARLSARALPALAMS